MRHAYIEPEHLLLGLVQVDAKIAHQLSERGLTLERLRHLAMENNPSFTQALPQYSETTRQLVSLAAGFSESPYVTPETLLQAVTQSKRLTHQILSHGQIKHAP